MLTPERKEKLVHTLRWIVKGRWAIVIGIAGVGVIQRFIINVSSVNLSPQFISGILGVALLANAIYYILLRQGEQRSEWTLRVLALAQVLVDQILFTIVIYFTGGTESLSFLFYFFPILMATVLFRTVGIILLAFFNSALYVTLVILENTETLPYIARYHFITGIHGNISVNISNTLTVVAAIMLAAFFSTYISTMIRDREREITSERDKINSILNSLTDGIIMLDAFGKVIALNPQGARMLKLRRFAVLGSRITLADFPEEVRQLGAYVIQPPTQEIIEAKDITVGGETSQVIYKITTIPVFNALGKLIGFMNVLKDYTRDREIDRMKSEFISVAAHQLRTPLSGVKWAMKMLLDGDMGPLNQEQEKFLRRGYENQERMIRLVNDLLDVSKIEEGRFQFDFQPAQLENIIEESIKNFERIIQAKKMNVRFEKPDEPLPAVKVDKEKIGLTIQNLLDNALKYTPDGGNVLIQIKREDDAIVTSIQDSGVGIPKEQQEKLFTKFFRARNVFQMHTEGSGLGLFIVRNIVRTHGGEIGVESEEGKGTRVWFSMPIEEVV